MAQFARPDNDDSIGVYTDEGAGTTNIFQSIDETSFSDSDFILAVVGGTPVVYIGGFSTTTDPAVSTGHILRWRYRKNTAAGRTIEAKLEIRVGTTVIVTRTFSDVSATFTQDDYTLLGAEADNISDYSDLNFRVTGTRGGSGAGRQIQVSWVELEVPDAAGGTRRIMLIT